MRTDMKRGADVALLAGAVTLTIMTILTQATRPARAQDCASMDPADWPQPAKPYFMVIADTSGSMAACTNPETVWPDTCDDVGGGVPNSCGYTPYRSNDAKCALENTVSAFAGQVNFGLATFSYVQSSCPSSCSLGQYWAGFWYRYLYSGCSYSGDQCAGANIVVPMLQDTDPPQTPNLSELFLWFDNACGDDKELFARGGTPLGGALNNIRTYFQSSFGGHTSPLTASDPDCRSLNVILLTDGGESCSGDPVSAAQALYNGFTKDGIFRRIYTHVIAFNVDAPGDVTTLNNIHKMGQCGATTGACANGVAAIQASNEVELANSLANIIAAAIPPEICDNEDNNCNGCVDEGFAKYCNTRAVCCAWSNDTQRDSCLASYEASIAANPPTGNLDLLPCTTPAQQQQPDYWLCYNPGEDCDTQDNNCDGQVDENLVLNLCGTCGPEPPEIPCNGIDDDCDGLVDDNDPDIPPGCTCGIEWCNGLDDDCDGLIDDDDPDMPAGAIPCGPDPALGTCQQGTMICNYGQGECIGAIWPVDEICDGRDENCNGIVDDVVYDPYDCVVPNCTGGCCQGHWECINGVDTCVPDAITATEECNGLDDDCDNRIDEGAICPAPLVCYYGTCVFRIPPDGCGTGYFSVEGLCVPNPCVGSHCPGGTICDPTTGDCVDPCEGYACADPNEFCDVTLATCDATGGCTVDETACVAGDCYLDPSLCGDGQVCEDGVCEDDPCFGTDPLDCDDQACHEGACVDTCLDVECDVGERCEYGHCVVVPCGTFTCPPGQACVLGQCAQDPCGGVTCGDGRVCKDGECVDDPCRLIVCPADAVCVDGQCVDASQGPDGGIVYPDAGPGPDAATAMGDAGAGGDAADDFELTLGGGGCQCSSGDSSDAPGLLLLLPLLFFFIRRRR